MVGLVFNIQRFSIQDGPGIRTTVFLKGCNLRCFWCHNPESLEKKPQIQYFQQKCIQCGKCLLCCPVQAHQIIQGNKIFDRDKCIQCGNCAENCYAEALVMTGKETEIEEVMAEILRDELFYKNSGGGVTFSGGEPFLQKDFLKELLIRCKEEGLHTAVESALNISWETLQEIKPYIDLFLVDIKVMDEKMHQAVTGASNNKILQNLKMLAKEAVNLRIRIPVIPGVNDNLNEMDKIADFLKELKGVHNVELMPYHSMAQGKYESLAMDNKSKGYTPPPEEFLKSAIDLFRNKGFRT